MNLNARSPEKRLKLLLVDRELELKDVARVTGLSLSLIGKIAAGLRKPTTHAVLRIENFFGERIFSSPREYRARQKKSRAGVIEISESSLVETDNATAPTAAVHQEATP